MFRIGESATHGRGLFATRKIQPGTEVFIERPAYFTPCDNKSAEQEGLEALAAHIVASNAPLHASAINALVSNAAELRKQEARRQALDGAITVVRAIINTFRR